MQSSNNDGISQDTLSQMLKIAGKKLGMNPEELRAALNDPRKANDLISSLDKKCGDQVKAAVNDPKAFEELLNSNPKAKKLFNDLMGGKRG